MNKEDMIVALDDGARVTHRYFSNEEWMERKWSRDLVFEDGVVCSEKDFFRIRSDGSWDSGWKVKDTDALPT